jgi:hypothetical protein
VKVDEDSERTINKDQTLLYSFNDHHTITIDFTDDNLMVADEILLPPDPLNVLALEAQYDRISPNSWAAILRPNQGPIIDLVTDVNPESIKKYNMTGRVTQLTLNGAWLSTDDLSLSVLRGTTFYAQSELLTLAEEPVQGDICGKSIELGAIYPGLQSGSWVIISGERTDIPNTSGVKASELVMLAGVEQSSDPDSFGNGTEGTSGVHSRLILDKGLAYTYDPQTVSIYANVVKATHGETKIEVLGSGDASAVFQQFQLRQPPLTYLAAATPAGAGSTL